MIAETIDIETADGTADCFFARPDDGGPYPAVILYMDAFGIRSALREHVKRLARNGYCVLAPNVFYRSGRAPVVENIEELIHAEDRTVLWAALKPRMEQVTPDAADSDSERWLGYLRSRGGIDGSTIGTVGYCMGGRLALRMAGEFPDAVGGAASFHGGNLATDQEDSPHLAAVKATGELYIGHADNDGSMPPEQMAGLTAGAGRGARPAYRRAVRRRRARLDADGYPGLRRALLRAALGADARPVRASVVVLYRAASLRSSSRRSASVGSSSRARR